MQSIIFDFSGSTFEFEFRSEKEEPTISIESHARQLAKPLWRQSSAITCHACDDRIIITRQRGDISLTIQIHLHYQTNPDLQSDKSVLYPFDATKHPGIMCYSWCNVLIIITTGQTSSRKCFTIALCGYPIGKMEIRDSSQTSTTAPIFLLSNYFRQKYLEIASCAVSLLNDIWVRVDHSLLQQLNLQKVNCSSSSLQAGCE